MTIDINRSKMHDYCIITDCLDKKYGSDGWDMRVLTQKANQKCRDACTKPSNEEKN